jgi:SWI/SNF-related matrix-associated actin-dependent regulator 1 of chromatin subfamily A
MITSRLCKICGKKAIEESSFTVAGILFQTFKCGHSATFQTISNATAFEDFTSLDGKRPFPFQKDGAVWAMNSNGRFLIMDEMGLGKTIQFLMVADSLPDTRFLICCKSSLKIQWAKETYRWCKEAPCQVIDSENEFILPGCKGYVISYDLLWRFKDIPAFIQKLNVNLIGLDEVQHLKNTNSKRTNGVRTACLHVDYIGALSGTPIKNNASEFFPILNILHPEKFPSAFHFQTRWVQQYWNGHAMKDGGLRNYEQFHEYTKDFIIRRTRAEVMPDLPKISRDFRFFELGSVVEEAYKATLKEFQKYYLFGAEGESGFEKTTNILTYLTKMRHITGIAKIDPVVEFVEDFLEETERKIVIFVHHKDVASSILNRLKALDGILDNNEILSLTSDLSPEQRDEVVQKFWSVGYRVLVASTLASGEGLNLQCCSDCIVVERQWNPANEEQAESRFIRIGQESNKVNATYPVAVGTVDEFFAEIVEKKRSMISNSLDGTNLAWDESNIMKELAEVLATSGGRRWGF